MNSAGATKSSSARCSTLFVALASVCLLNIAGLAFAQETVRYSSYFDGPPAIGAGSDGSIVAAGTGARPGTATDIQINRFAPSTHTISAATFVGGSGDDIPVSIAVAPDGSIWISGTTNSADFPLVNPIQTGPVFSGGSAFLLHLASDRSTVLFSTVFAVGSGSSSGATVALMPNGSVAWSGFTEAGGVPVTPNSFQPVPGGSTDGFVATFSGSGALLAASYLGGAAADGVSSIAVGPDGAIYAAGAAASMDLRTTPGAFQTGGITRTCQAFSSQFQCRMGFVGRLAPDLTRIDYLTYLHGTDPAHRGADTIGAIAVNAAGEAFVTGNTESGNSFPITAGAYQTTCRVCGGDAFARGGGDVFVTRLNASGSALLYSTFLSGSTLADPASLVRGQAGTAIAVDAAGRAFVAGYTAYGDFPVVHAHQSLLHGKVDAFVARLDATGSALQASTFLGGAEASTFLFDLPVGLALTDPAGAAVWVSGRTSAPDFPATSDAYEPTPPASPDTAGFVTAFLRADARLTIDVPAAGTIGPSFAVGGWAIDRGAAADAGIDAIHVYAYPNPGSGAPPIFVGAASLGFARGDIGAIYGSQFANAGWTLDAGPLASGTYLLAVWARSSVTGTFDVVQTRTITVAIAPPILTIDTPGPGATTGTPLLISGSAIDLRASAGTGIDAIHVWAYPDPGSGAAPVFLGVATYGSIRNDVSAIHGSRFAPSGYEVRPSLAAGTYLIAVSAHSAVTGAFDAIATRLVTVIVNPQPLLTIDVPSPGATSSSPAFIGGWAIDLGAGTGTGIDAIHVWAYPNPGSGAAPFFVGVATYGVMRSDIGAIFGSQFAPSGYELSAPMAPGTYLLAVAGHSTVSGGFAVLQTRIVTIQ